MEIIFSFVPILFLIWLMVKKNGMPSNKALPLSAIVLYFICLIIFKYDPNAVHANVVKGLLVAWTPITIIGGAILLFKTMEITGGIATVKKVLNGVSENPIAQLMIVGWAFPFLIEGASGFGTPAAIAAPILVGLGFHPLKVALLALIMNTVPVSFGAVGAPTWFGFSQISLTDAETYAIGFQSAIVHTVASFFIVTIALLQVVDFQRIVKNGLFVFLSISATVIPYLIVASFDYEFPSLIGGLTGMILSIIIAKMGIGLKKEASKVEASTPEHVKPLEILKATFPIWGTILLLVITRIPDIGLKALLQSQEHNMHVSFGAIGEFYVSSSLVFQLKQIFLTDVSWSHKLLYVPSLLPFVVISMTTLLLYRKSIKTYQNVFVKTYEQMIKPSFALFGALVFVNLMMMGEATSIVSRIGNTLASVSGKNWAFFASYLGAIGSFFSGSATISNLTFAGIQDAIATSSGLDRTLILSLQSVGAAFGNMICINNIVAVASVLAIANKEGYILKKTIVPAIIYGVIAGLLVLVL